MMKRSTNPNSNPMRMRNPLHNHPLLKKGGEHRKSNKTLRQQARQALRRGWRSLMAVKMTVMRQRHPAQSIPHRSFTLSLYSGFF